MSPHKPCQGIILLFEARPSVVSKSLKNASKLMLHLSEAHLLNVENDVSLLDRLQVVAPNSFENDIALPTFLLRSTRVFSFED